jgi:hypothetical protein
MLPCHAAPLAALVFAFGPAPAAPETGFQEQVAVKQPTRLDWEFAAASLAPAGEVTLPASYESARQVYQLYVPPAYESSKAWPLVLFLSPGDDPLGWRYWQKACADEGVFFCAAYGGGDACAPAPRVRLVLDVLDDVRRRFRIDPDQTYLAGQGGGGRAACAVAFALPEYFGGVAVAGDGAPLNRLAYLRGRARERLSAAFLAPPHGGALPAYLEELGVRAKAWTPKDAAGAPAPSAWAEAYAWLAADLPRRRAAAKARPGLAVGPGEALTNLEQATRALEAARDDLNDPDTVGRGAALLEGVVARWGRTDPADRARALLQELRADPRRRRPWADQADAEEGKALAAEARLRERTGDARGALQAWQRLAADYADAPEAAKAAAEAKRLTAALAAAPWLGLQCDADGVTVKAVVLRGPADEAGVKPGDRLVRFGAAELAAPGDLAAALRAAKPGDKVELEVQRDDRPRTLTVAVGSPPSAKE